MPPLEVMDLLAPAVLWGFLRPDRQGDPLVAAPVEIDTRWEEGQVEKADAEGNVLVVDAVLASAQNIVLNSLVWEGSLDDLDEAYPDRAPTRNLYEVVTRERATDLKNRVTRYEFGLRRYKNKLPNVVT